MRCLVDVPGEKLPSQVSGALAEYLSTHVANEVSPSTVQNLFLSSKILTSACNDQGSCIMAGCANALSAAIAALGLPVAFTSECQRPCRCQSSCASLSWKR